MVCNKARELVAGASAFGDFWEAEARVLSGSEAKGGWEVSAERSRTARSRLGSRREKEPKKLSLKLLQQLQP